MDFYGSHFEYRDVDSRVYNLVFSAVEQSRYTGKTGTISGSFFFNRKTKRRYLLDDDFSDSAISFDVEITTCDGRPLERNELRDIPRWLFGSRQFHKLYFNYYEDKDLMLTEYYNIDDGRHNGRRSYMNCRFINPEEIYGNGGTVGYKATLESDSPYLWQEEVSKTIILESETEFIEINVDSDVEDYTYPRVDVKKTTEKPFTPSKVPIKIFDADHEIQDPAAFIKEGIKTELASYGTASPPYLKLANDSDSYVVAITAAPFTTYSIRVPKEYCSILMGGAIISGKEDLKGGQRFETGRWGYWYAEYDQDSSGSASLDITTSSDSKYILIYYIPKTGYKGDLESNNGINYTTDTMQFQFWNISENLSQSAGRFNVYGLELGDSFVIDGSTNYTMMKKSGGAISNTFDGFYCRHFPRLINGQNRIRIDGDVGDTVTLSWSNRRLL